MDTHQERMREIDVHLGCRMKILFLVAAMLWTTVVFADDKPLVVGVEEQDYLPNYGWKDGVFYGAGSDILGAFAADQGYKITYRALPIRRLYAETFNGNVDIKFPDSPDWAADVKKGFKLTYSTPVIGFIDGVVVKPDRLGHGISAIHTLGTMGGFTVSNDWRSRISAGTVELKENSRLDQLLRQVMLDRVDGAYVSVAAALYVVDKSLGQKGGLAFDPGLPFQKGNYLASSVSHPEIIQEFNRWMAGHQDQIKGIKTRWGVDSLY